MPRKEPKERVQLEAPSRHVEDWRKEADLLEITLSEFIRRACRAFSAKRKKNRGESPKPIPKQDENSG